MNPDDMKSNSGNLFYSTDGKTWNPIGEVQNLHLTDPVEIRFEIKISEEEAAKLYAQLDPLEIVTEE